VTRLSRDGPLERPAERIVSLLPSATEIVCALGLADRLVGVTHECDAPAEVVNRLPRLTANRAAPATHSSGIDAAVRTALAEGHGLYELDEELLDELAPDLILTQELCSVCAVSYPTVLEAARAAGGADEPLVVSLEPHTLSDVRATIELVAELAGVGDDGRRLTAELARRMAPRRRTVRPRLALVEWLDPLFAPGHWVPEQVQAAGGDPVLGTAGARSTEIAWSELATADPQVVVLGLCGFDLDRTLDEWRAFSPPAELQSTTAWRRGELWAIDGSAYVSRPGPRLADGIEIMAAVIDGRTDPRAVRLPAE
jgi:iron complex transport system substrate-binding protein